jgi:hypothetical protein
MKLPANVAAKLPANVAANVPSVPSVQTSTSPRPPLMPVLPLSLISSVPLVESNTEYNNQSASVLISKALRWLCPNSFAVNVTMILEGVIKFIYGNFIPGTLLDNPVYIESSDGKTVIIDDDQYFLNMYVKIGHVVNALQMVVTWLKKGNETGHNGVALAITNFTMVNLTLPSYPPMIGLPSFDNLKSKLVNIAETIVQYNADPTNLLYNHSTVGIAITAHKFRTFAYFNNMISSNPTNTFKYLLSQINEQKSRFLLDYVAMLNCAMKDAYYNVYHADI